MTNKIINTFTDLNVGDVFSYKDIWENETISKYVAIVEKKTPSKLSINVFFINEGIDDGSPQENYDETFRIKGKKVDERYIFDKFLWTENISQRLHRLENDFPECMNL